MWLNEKNPEQNTGVGQVRCSCACPGHFTSIDLPCVYEKQNANQEKNKSVSASMSSLVLLTSAFSDDVTLSKQKP